MASTFAIVLTCGTLWLAGQDPETAQQAADEVQLAGATSDVATRPGGDAGNKAPQPSDAQHIARLQRTIESDRKELEAIQRADDDPNGEYRESEAEFQKIDDQWLARRQEIEDLRRANRIREADRLAADSQQLKARWQVAKDRFDLAINWRKTVREKAAVLEKKTRQDSEALDTLVGNDPLPAPPLSSSAADPQAALTAEGGTQAARAPAPQGAGLGQPVPAAEAPAPLPLSPLAQLPPAAPAAPERADDESGDTAQKKREIAKAQKEADDRRAAAQEAEHRVTNVNERHDGLREEIKAEQHLLELAHTKADQAQTAREKIGKELQDTLASNPAETVHVWEEVAEADKRYATARAEVQKTQDRLDELRNELTGLQGEQLTALQDVKQKHDEADAAQDTVDRLQNPFTLTNIGNWFLEHGPKLLAILVGTLLLSLVVRISGRHLAQAVARSGLRGSARDRENRALTLVGVFRNTAAIALITGGLLMTLDEVGIPIAPLMGGAAVLGLAVAFGAQNLIRDYFTGFMVLLEDQYGVNDVVKISDVAGSVEKITLRTTVLRDLEGAVHFIPHGSITTVTNMTHGWSRALVEIGVGYGEDADRVMSVLMDIGRELRKDPTYGPLILDGPEMLGLDSLGDSAVVFKFYVKTQPTQRWFVRRELLRRIKIKFDELGIEIPFPQRTVHIRREDGDLESGGPPGPDSEK